jgi:chromosome partitioning protein
MATFVSRRNGPQFRILNDGNVIEAPIRDDFAPIPAPAGPLNLSLTISARGSGPANGAVMNVITLASRKGGAGKSTLTAQLAAQCHLSGKRTLIIDADPQGSLSLWHSLRKDGLPRLVTPERGIERAIAFAMIDEIDYVFIDTAPTMWVVVQEAIRAATLTLIPARPGFFDLAAVRETVRVARERDCPYAVVINAAPVKRDDKESGLVAQSRAYFDGLQIPVWAGQISQRAGFQSTLAAGASAAEIGPNTAAGVEIAKLWAAVEKSVAAINNARFEPGPAANDGAGGAGERAA